MFLGTHFTLHCRISTGIATLDVLTKLEAKFICTTENVCASESAFLLPQRPLGNKSNNQINSKTQYSHAYLTKTFYTQYRFVSVSGVQHNTLYTAAPQYCQYPPGTARGYCNIVGSTPSADLHTPAATPSLPVPTPHSLTFSPSPRPFSPRPFYLCWI